MTASAHANRRLVFAACPLCGEEEGATIAGDASVTRVQADRPRADETGTTAAQLTAEASASTAASLETEATGVTEWVSCRCSLIYKRSEPADWSATPRSPGDASDLPDAAHYDEAYFDRYDRRRRHRIAKSRRQIRDALEVAPQGALLDVGCSLGYAMEAARSLGLTASGVDLAPHALARCRQLGFEAREGTLENLPFDDASFAVVILKHVFEHTSVPRAALAELRRVTVDGAALFFAVPNALYFKAVNSPGTSRFFRGEAGRAHQVYWSPATLSRLLEEEGFRVVSLHPRLWHSRSPLLLRVAEALALPLRLPIRAAADVLRLRKEFWLVATRERRRGCPGR